MDKKELYGQKVVQIIDNQYVNWIFIRIFMVFNHLDMNRGYPTNLTDNQWQILQKFLEPTTRKRKYSLRDIMDTLREKLRVALGREESPSVGIIDLRSVKTSQISVYVFPEDVKMKNGIFLQKRTMIVQFY